MYLPSSGVHLLYPVLLKIKQFLDWAKLGEDKGEQRPKQPERILVLLA